MGVNRNLLGGIALRDAIKTSMPSATINDQERYIQFTASAEAVESISGAAGMVFKPNTQYTFIMSLFKTGGTGSNLRILYTDGTTDDIPSVSSALTKESVLLVSDSGKTVESLYKRNSSNSTRVYYDECGIFEGVLTTLDFEPYQAWGITMSEIRRSLVEAALHDDTTVAAPIATFSTDVAAPAKSVLASMSPIQDLHGYENPWPAGGNKNLLPTIASTVTSDVTLTNDNGQYTLNGTASANAFFTVNLDTPLDAGTYTWQLFNPSTSSGVTCYLLLESGNKSMVCSVANQVSVGLSVDYKITAFRIRVDSGTALSSFKISPTLVSGSTELTAFSPYSNICPITGHTGVTAYRTGVNVWDEEWEVGIISSTTGGNVSDSQHIRSKNFSPCLPDTSYYGFIPSGEQLRIYWYDKDKNFISAPTASTAKVYTTPSNCYYFKLVTWLASYGTTYNHDISINYPATDTDYHAYNGTTYPVTWQDEAGTVYGGTVDLVSGVLTVTHGYVDLGTLTWGYYSPNSLFYSSGISSTAAYVSMTTVANAMCDIYKTVMANGYNTGIDMTISIGGAVVSKGVNVKDSRFSDAASFTIGVSGVQFCYELAEPLTYQLTPTQIQMLLGVNNVWANANGDITVQYWLHG